MSIFISLFLYVYKSTVIICLGKNVYKIRYKYLEIYVFNSMWFFSKVQFF